MRDLPAPVYVSSVRARGLGPRGGGTALAMTNCSVLPSVPYDAVGPPKLILLSRLNTQPARYPVNASPLPSRTTTHDSGLTWFATPSLGGTCTRETYRFVPAHFAVGTALTGGPPHRSQRALLTHWAPTSGHDAQSLFGVRVQNTNAIRCSTNCISHPWSMASQKPRMSASSIQFTLLRIGEAEEVSLIDRVHYLDHLTGFARYAPRFSLLHSSCRLPSRSSP